MKAPSTSVIMHTHHIDFSHISENDIESFQGERAKILSAVYDRFQHDPVILKNLATEEQRRLAHECADILVGNFYACAKYQLPGALIEYLDWLSEFLQNRSFDGSFLPRLLHSIQISSNAFTPSPANEKICRAFRDLKKHTLAQAQGATP